MLRSFWQGPCLCLLLLALECANANGRNVDAPQAGFPDAEFNSAYASYIRAVPVRKVLEKTQVTRDIMIYVDKSAYPPDDLEWSGTGDEPDNEHYRAFTGQALSAVYLEKTPEGAGVTAFITKVERQHPPKKQQMCSTAPSLFMFSLSFRFEFDELSGGVAEQAVDTIEQSIKRVLRCLPHQMSAWTEMRQTEVDALPVLADQGWGSNRPPEYLLQGTHDFKAIRIFDGDTIWAAVIVRNQAWKINCRLLGIDTPEIPRSHADAMDAKDAYFARDRLVELLTGIKLDYTQEFKGAGDVDMPSLTDSNMQAKIDAENKVVIRQGLTVHGTGKFGRYLVTLKAINGSDVAEILLAEGHATIFNG